MVIPTNSLIQHLLGNPDPIIRWKMIRYGLAKDQVTSKSRHANIELNSSPIIQKLLSDRDSNGQIPFHPYNKWFGAHWVLVNSGRLVLP